MKCPACGADNPENASYCSLCFSRFDELISSEARRAASARDKADEGARIICPNCEELNPVDTYFCMRCGFIFDSVDDLLVTPEKAAQLEAKKRAVEEEVFRERLSEPIQVDDGFSGADLMRRIEKALEAGARPRFVARGRNSVTHLMKLLALASLERGKSGKDVFFRVRLAEEEIMPDLDDVELEVILEERDGGTTP